METQVRTPQLVFMQPQRLVVPLFQRPYVWTKERQWEPLWDDVERMANRVLEQPGVSHHPHFLGAVVLQQVSSPTGMMQERTIIDGQQRLTTLQLLLDALHAELAAVEASQPALRIEPLVSNAEPFCARPEDRFKVWPTNRDRPAFQAVMSATPPVDHDGLGLTDERIVAAHRFFSESARRWLRLGESEAIAGRAQAVEKVVRDLLQIVVIDLEAEENAQEIFETLNARGAQLTAADLIKNFVFQKLLESGADVEAAYRDHWKEFESAFWEAKVAVGRLGHPRSSLFLNHWLVARTGAEVIAREVFDRFKRFAGHEAGVPMTTLVRQIHHASRVYRHYVDCAATSAGPIERLGLFGYRIGVLESEVIKPFVLCLLDPELAAIEPEQLLRALQALESWMVRRMLVRATTKNYNQVVAELVRLLRGEARSAAGSTVERFLAEQTSPSRYWPDDRELRDELEQLPAYRRLGRGRLRMVLEAIEDQKRGWTDGARAIGDERVARGKHAIEHILPRKWNTHWPLPEAPDAERERELLLHTLGNLTLITARLNSKVSNGPWLGANGKRAGLEGHDVLFLNRDLVKSAAQAWTHESIRRRTLELADSIVRIWPVPVGHSSGFAHPADRHRRHAVHLSDLLAAGQLESGVPLFPRRKKFASRVARLLGDGQVEVDGAHFSSPSDAARSITSQATNGWWFFLVDPSARRSLSDVRRQYIESQSLDLDEEGSEEEGEDDEG